MDIIQITLFFVILIISTLLVIVGIQTFLLLLDIKKTLHKLDNIITDIEHISSGLSKSSLALGTMFESLRSGVELAGAATKIINAITTKTKSN